MNVPSVPQMTQDFDHSTRRVPERSPSTGISVLIVGAGVSGLLAALECWRKGHNVRIIEKSLMRLRSGNGFSIGPAAIRALQKWPEMAEENERISYTIWTSWHQINGEKVAGPSPVELNASDDKETTFNGITRPNKVYRHNRLRFHKMMSDQAERIGIFVEYVKRAVEYYEDAAGQKAGVVLENEERIEADLIIAADGIGTKSSIITMGKEVRARSSGSSIYGGTIPIEAVQADPLISERFSGVENGIAVVELWQGHPEYHCLWERTPDHLSWAFVYPDQSDETESWTRTADLRDVLHKTSQIEGWPEIGDRAIRATPKDRIHDFKLVLRESQPCWVSPAGRVAQIGDAAHTFLPSSGNGATQGLEDAVSLATCLQVSMKDNIPWATRVHNTLRFDRVSCLQKIGIINGVARSRPVDEDNPQGTLVGLLGAWLWKHDPEQYAIDNYDKALAHLQDGTTFHNTNVPRGYVHTPWTIDELLDPKKAEEIWLARDWN